MDALGDSEARWVQKSSHVVVDVVMLFLSFNAYNNVALLGMATLDDDAGKFPLVISILPLAFTLKCSKRANTSFC